MSSIHLPLVGPGTQDDEAPEYLAMPRDMATFRMPSSDVVDRAPARATLAARALLLDFQEAMRAWGFAGTPGPRLDLASVPADALDVINQALGQGEVSVKVTAPAALRIQETAFASIWRVQHLGAEGQVIADALEAAALPGVIRESLFATGNASLPVPPEPPGLMNSPAILREVLDQAVARRDGDAAHVINLTLLPVTQEDLAYLANTLGVGPVTILSRGYGNCRITATTLAGVFWVQYFNSMEQLILDTLEIVDVPEVALAARQDFEDTLERLTQWLEMLRVEAQA